MSYRSLAAVPLFVLAAPVLADEDARYAEPPVWVEPLYDGSLGEARDNIPLYDRQVRLEKGTVTRYTDIAYRLDSRALAYYRLGRNDEAMGDLNAALAQEPGQAASLLLRGLIRLERGDRSGREDLVHARRIEPGIDRQ